MERKNKTPFIKKAIVNGTAILMSAITAISGFSVAFAKTNKIKNTIKFEGRKKVSLNAEALNTTIPSEEKLDELVEVQTPEVNKEVSTNETKNEESVKTVIESSDITSESEIDADSLIIEDPVRSSDLDLSSEIEENSIEQQVALEENYNFVEDNSSIITDGYYRHKAQVINPTIAEKIDDTVTENNQIERSDDYSSINMMTEQTFNCPKDETDEQREARLKAASDKRLQWIEEEKLRYNNWIANIYGSLLKTYSKYYHLNGDKVVAIAKKMTKDYTIDFNKFVKSNVYFNRDSIEASIMMYVQQLSKNRLTVSISTYGYTLASITTTNKIDTLKPNLILSNGESYSAFLGKICELMGVEKVPALALSYLESGRNIDSGIARNRNNFGGMRGSNGWLSFVTPEAGIIAYVQLLKSYEYDYGRKLTTNYNDIVRFGQIYCPGDYGWVNLLQSLSYEVNRDQLKLFGHLKPIGGVSYLYCVPEITKGSAIKSK